MDKLGGLLTPLALAGSLALGLACRSAAAEKLQLEVSETAGIRRFGYPIAMRLPDSLSGIAVGHFRLLDGDKPVSAQLRREPGDDGAGGWWLDFNVSMMPDEVRTFVLEYGPDVAAEDEPPGLEVEPTADGFVVRNQQHITWTVGRDLHHIMRSVESGGLHYLRPEGVRLGLAGPDGRPYKMDAKAIHVRVVRSGPLAIAIRYELAPTAGPLAKMKAVVDLTFPVSKSWVQVDCRIDDPRQAVRSARAEIAQKLDAPSEEQPTLVDFGASSLVYMSLAPGTTGRLEARAAAPLNGSPPQSWQVLRGAKDQLQPFVARPGGLVSGDAEGWAHIMDRRRCLALAIDEFGDSSADSIEATAEGDVTIARKFATDEADRLRLKKCRFWLHFVGFPPHLTAATSPQSMLAPLRVRSAMD